MSKLWIIDDSSYGRLPFLRNRWTSPFNLDAVTVHSLSSTRQLKQRASLTRLLYCPLFLHFQISTMRRTSRRHCTIIGGLPDNDQPLSIVYNTRSGSPLEDNALLVVLLQFGTMEYEHDLGQRARALFTIKTICLLYLYHHYTLAPHTRIISSLRRSQNPIVYFRYTLLRYDSQQHRESREGSSYPQEAA